MTKEAYFEELSYALRRRELLPRPMEEDGLLPVEWNGRILCRVTERGAVRYDPTWVDTARAKAALAQVAEAAGTVMDYMTLLEEAPPLKAEGLADGYRVLAEFNGTVLAGTETLLGALVAAPAPQAAVGPQRQDVVVALVHAGDSPFRRGLYWVWVRIHRGYVLLDPAALDGGKLPINAHSPQDSSVLLQDQQGVACVVGRREISHALRY